MKKRRWGKPVMIGALLILCAGIARHVLRAQAERKRQAEYQMVLKKYSNALKPGMTRPEAESYLQAKKLPFQRMCCVAKPQKAWADLIKIGKEEAPWYCNAYNIYVALEFSTSEPRGVVSDARNCDRLESVTLFPRLEGCL